MTAMVDTENVRAVSACATTPEAPRNSRDRRGAVSTASIATACGAGVTAIATASSVAAIILAVAVLVCVTPIVWSMVASGRMPTKPDRLR